MDSHFHVLMNTYDYEDALFRLDHKLRDYRELKEMYVRFNSRNAGNSLAAQIELTELIEFYANSEYSIFRDFQHFLISIKSL